VEAVLRVAAATGCRGFNLLYGQLREGEPVDAQRAAAVAAYRRAAEAVGEVGGTVLVEPLAEGLNGAYPLTTHHDALDLVDEVGSADVRFLLDTFHLGSNGLDVPSVVLEAAGAVGHVQLADAPGRGEPGSGDLDWAAIAAALGSTGYRGTVAAEYRPTAETRATLSWLSPGPESATRLS
jgi:hydroxypyruvate isomerase